MEDVGSKDKKLRLEIVDYENLVQRIVFSIGLWGLLGAATPEGERRGSRERGAANRDQRDRLSGGDVCSRGGH